MSVRSLHNGLLPVHDFSELGVIAWGALSPKVMNLRCPGISDSPLAALLVPLRAAE